MTMSKRIARGLLVTVVAAAAASCNPAEAPTTPIVFVGPPNLVITDVRVGDGATFRLGQEARVHYGLWLYDPRGTDSKGTFIEDSRSNGNGQPFVTRLAAGTIIQGWIDGLPGMKVGGLRRLIIPPSLAFGDRGGPAIPPNAWLVFDIDLLSIAD